MKISPLKSHVAGHYQTNENNLLETATVNGGASGNYGNGNNVTNPLAGANDPSAMQQFQMAQGIGGIFQGLFGRKKEEQSKAMQE